MAVLFAVKTMADLAFYFAFAAFLWAALFGVETGVYPLLILTLCAWGCAVLRERGILRFVPLLLPPVALAAAYLAGVPVTLAYLGVVAPAFLYVAYGVLRLNIFSGIFQYGKIFTTFLKIYIPLFLIMLAIEIMRVYLQAYSVIFALLFFIAAISVMNMARHNPDVHSERNFRLMGLGALSSLVIVGGVAGSRAFLGLAGRFLGFVLRGILGPGFYFLTDNFFRGIGWLLSLLPDITQRTKIGRVGGFEVGVDLQQPTEDSNTFLIWLAAITIIVVITSLILLARKLMPQFATASDRIFIRTRLARSQSSHAIRDYRNPMRRQYRRFLRLCHARGIADHKYKTSQAYATQAAEDFRLEEEAHELRRLYLPVRYGGKTAEKADIAAARELYKRIKVKAISKEE